VAEVHSQRTMKCREKRLRPPLVNYRSAATEQPLIPSCPQMCDDRIELSFAPAKSQASSTTAAAPTSLSG